jgi:hypothetical protein
MHVFPCSLSLSFFFFFFFFFFLVTLLKESVRPQNRYKKRYMDLSRLGDPPSTSRLYCSSRPLTNPTAGPILPALRTSVASFLDQPFSPRNEVLVAILPRRASEGGGAPSWRCRRRNLRTRAGAGVGASAELDERRRT